MTDTTYLPVARWINQLADPLQNQPAPFIEAIGHGIAQIGEAVQSLLLATPPLLAIAVFGVVGYWRRGVWLGAFCAAALALIHAMGFGEQLMVTLAQVITATVLTLLIGLPLGIFLGTRPLATQIVRPLLDFMQTMPAFVYLIPAAMLFGLGLAPALLATMVFSLPPVVRLTALAFRQVGRDVVEAASLLGASPLQVLWRVRFPQALPVIMTGVSQTIMMALSMVIIASMVGAGGLGSEVLSAIQRLDVGQGTASGLCVVLLAIVVDRITESFAPLSVQERSV